MVAAIVAEAEMVAGLYHGAYFLAEADDALVALVASFVDVVELSDVSFHFQFFQENFPVVLAYIFE